MSGESKWHKCSFRRNTSYFAVLHTKPIPMKLDYTFLLMFLCWRLGSGQKLSIFLSLVPFAGTDYQEHSTEYSAFVQWNGHNESSFSFLVPKVLNEFLDVQKCKYLLFSISLESNNLNFQILTRMTTEAKKLSPNACQLYQEFLSLKSSFSAFLI